MHPDLRARMGRHVEPATTAEGLVLRDLVGVMDFAVIDAAGMDIKGEAEQLFAHDRAFEMPAGGALAPRTVPFHLPCLARRCLAPDRKIGSVALAFYCFDPALALFSYRASKPPVIGDCRHVEIEAGVEFVAMPVGNALCEIDHLVDVIGRHRPLGRLADVERLHVRPIGFGVMLGDVPDRLRLGRSHLFHLVFARIAIVGQMTHVGDVDDVGELVALPAQCAAKDIGKDIGPHVADMGVVVDRRPAAVDARFPLVNGPEFLQLAGERIEQLQGRVGHETRIRWRHAYCQPSQRTLSSVPARWTSKLFTGASVSR